MTDKNIIKNWFKSGAKPNQEQFWNWQDSYWHKTEIIPQNQIQDLDTTLANKADSSTLDTKANTDGSGLSAENIISWKEVLGVGGGTTPNFQSVMNEGTYAKVQDFHIGIHHLYPNHFAIQRDEYHNSYSLSTYSNVSEKYQAGVRKNYIDGRFLNNVNMLYEISEEGHAFYTHYNSTSPQESYVMKIGINSKVVINPAYHNADGDNAYTHRVVSKPDGTLGMVPMVEEKMVTLKEDFLVVLNNPETQLDTIVPVPNFSIDVQGGKIYELEAVICADKQSPMVGKIIREVEAEPINNILPLYYVAAQNVGSQYSTNIFAISNQKGFWLNTYHSSPTFVKGVIAPNTTGKLRLELYLSNPITGSFTVKKGSYIRIKEIM